ncbi:DUF333 domain-containing protein [Sandaracinobacter neustonicus]|uniref:DUF333 domain-containing protein n=1 Tax=Sandaracinobacter neustonicus TaxID=1715348 RepID=A0A501XIH7_9SPHN|nr:DUF333 domain-containing protein [Sandaracinobacter neustonicus]TPE60104.1 DUF333 domain-containing protein [Sandaracinobacter neustonicus]
MKRLLPLILLAACSQPEPPEKPIGMPNPASKYCTDQGGKLEIRNGPGGQTGWCHLPDGRVVEEWALFRAAKPVG